MIITHYKLAILDDFCYTTLLMSLEEKIDLNRCMTALQSEEPASVAPKEQLIKVFKAKIHGFRSSVSTSIALAMLLQKSLQEQGNPTSNLPRPEELTDQLINTLNQFSSRITYSLDEIRLTEANSSKSVSVDDFLQGVVQTPDNIDLISSNGIELDLQRSNQGLKISTEPTELAQVFNELLLNAVHAMEDSPVKQMTISNELSGGERVTILVTDTGKGIPAAIQGQIFHEWFTTKRGTQQNGTGLGLPISRDIVEKFGGSLDLKQSQEGKGSTFVISLPLISD